MMISSTQQTLMDALAAPFSSSDVEWRAGSTNGDKTKAMALAYITSRAVMQRLDDTFGLGCWWDDYSPGPNGGILCRLTVSFEENGKIHTISKCGIADNTDFEAVKGGESDSLKRAAVKFGIGRYLYKLPTKWVACEQRGKSIVLKEIPSLPEWALPSGTEAPRQSSITSRIPAANWIVVGLAEKHNGKRISMLSDQALAFYASGKFTPQSMAGRDSLNQIRAYLKQKDVEPVGVR